jgi:hypothetical protein
MQRNPELIRHILLKIEELPFPNQYMSFQFKDYKDLEITYHVTLLTESDLVEAEAHPYSCFDEWSNVRLTWQGHELTDLIRDEKRWQQALEKTGQTGSVNFEILKKQLLADIAAS